MFRALSITICALCDVCEYKMSWCEHHTTLHIRGANSYYEHFTLSQKFSFIKELVLIIHYLIWAEVLQLNCLLLKIIPISTSWILFSIQQTLSDIVPSSKTYVCRSGIQWYVSSRRNVKKIPPSKGPKHLMETSTPKDYSIPFYFPCKDKESKTAHTIKTMRLWLYLIFPYIMYIHIILCSHEVFSLLFRYTVWKTRGKKSNRRPITTCHLLTSVISTCVMSKTW